MPPAAFPSWIDLFPWMAAAIVACAFVWGALLGSFVNVVAHRMPRGVSIVHGRSRCPHCGAAIRPRDNVPVVGWLWLRGRCRDCAAPISARYPLVEAGCGLLVAAAAVVDVVPGGMDRALMWEDWLPVARFGFHGAALVTLVAWDRLAAAGPGVPRPAALVALAAAGVAAIAWPGIQPIGVLPDGAPWPTSPPRLAALVAWMAGTAAGWIAGHGPQGRMRAMLPLLGATFGWQAVTVVAAVTAAVRALGKTAGRAADGR